jgi:hypothetical protein
VGLLLNDELGIILKNCSYPESIDISTNMNDRLKIAILISSPRM